MLNPDCATCGEALQLARVGDVVWDYVPSAPALMRLYMAFHGPDAPIYECFASGCGWLPAIASPFGNQPGQAPAG